MQSISGVKYDSFFIKKQKQNKKNLCEAQHQTQLNSISQFQRLLYTSVSSQHVSNETPLKKQIMQWHSQHLEIPFWIMLAITLHHESH